MIETLRGPISPTTFAKNNVGLGPISSVPIVLSLLFRHGLRYALDTSPNSLRQGWCPECPRPAGLDCVTPRVGWSLPGQRSAVFVDRYQRLVFSAAVSIVNDESVRAKSATAFGFHLVSN
jgi:hypothetical protein